MNENSYFSTSLLAFGVVSVLDLSHSNRWVVGFHVVLICNSIMTYDVEHLFIRLFAICIFSLVRCLQHPLFTILKVCFPKCGPMATLEWDHLRCLLEM